MIGLMSKTKCTEKSESLITKTDRVKWLFANNQEYFR